MPKRKGYRLLGRARLASACAVALLYLVGVGAPAYGNNVSDVVLVFDTELLSLSLTGGPFLIPLASDPNNTLGDSIDGYGFVNSRVDISLSSQRATTGQALACISCQLPQAGVPPTPLTPSLIDSLDGQQFFVQSFFDVFFDITVTDVDARSGRDFASMPDGASVLLPNNGPAHMDSLLYSVKFDQNAPNFGLIPPPEAAPYSGSFKIEIPLGGDINGNGENDKIKFTQATNALGDTNRTFITLPDGTVLDIFDSAAFLAGVIVDEMTDPPFTIGIIGPDSLPDGSVFGGPTTASSKLQNAVVPEPSSVLLLGSGLLGLLGYGMRRRLAKKA